MTLATFQKAYQKWLTDNKKQNDKEDWSPFNFLKLISPEDAYALLDWNDRQPVKHRLRDQSPEELITLLGLKNH